MRVHTIDVGCSGMAGTFGLKRKNFDLSRLAGKPMIEHVLDNIAPIPGIDRVYVVTNDKFAAPFQHVPQHHDAQPDAPGDALPATPAGSLRPTASGRP